MKKFLIAAASLVALAGPALAADMAPAPTIYSKAPPPAPIYSWTGFYAGVNVGGGWGTRKVGYSPNDPASAVFIGPDFAPLLGDSIKTSGVLGGGQLGYNYQFNRNWLIGFETDFDGTAMKGSSSTTQDEALILSSIEQRIDWFGTVRARLGFLPTDNLLAYVTGGFAYGSVEQSGSITSINGGGFAVAEGTFGVACKSPPGTSTINGVPITNPTCFAGASRDISAGWTVGGGLEYALSQGWSLKAEYLYVNLGTKPLTEIGSPDPRASSVGTINAGGHANFNVARIGLNYKFGGPVVAKY